jgi:hypothetical protein
MPIFRKRLQRFSRFNGETCHISDLWARLRSFQTNSSTSSSPFTAGTYVTSGGLWSSASVCCGHRQTLLPRFRLPLILRPREGWRLFWTWVVHDRVDHFRTGGMSRFCVFAQRFFLSLILLIWFNLNYPSFPVLLFSGLIAFLECIPPSPL